MISSNLFRHYIDPLLNILCTSGYGCHIGGVYYVVFSYANNITISCPCIDGLNEMLKICNNFEKSNEIISKIILKQYASSMEKNRGDENKQYSINRIDNEHIYLYCYAMAM